MSKKDETKPDKKSEGQGPDASRSQRLVGHSEELRRLTTVPEMKALSPKRHGKLVRQVESWIVRSPRLGRLVSS
jgi:hypothetical protein